LWQAVIAKVFSGTANFVAMPDCHFRMEEYLKACIKGLVRSAGNKG
jgi:hypothetical protein